MAYDLSSVPEWYRKQIEQDIKNAQKTSTPSKPKTQTPTQPPPPVNLPSNVPEHHRQNIYDDINRAIRALEEAEAQSASKPAASPTVQAKPKTTTPAQTNTTNTTAVKPTVSDPLISNVTNTTPTTTPITQTTAPIVTDTSTTTPAPAPVDNSQQIQQMIAELLEAQKQQQIAALEAARTRALSGLESTYLSRQGALERAKSTSQANLETALQKAMENLATEEAKIRPFYYDARNQVQAASDVGALNFAQYMASRGVQGSAAGMPEIYRNAALQGQIGALNRQQLADQAAIERARTTTQNQYETNLANITNQYASDLALLEQEYLKAQEGIREAYEQDMLAAQAGINAQGLQAYIDQLNADRLFSLNEAEITGRYGGQPTLQAQLAEAELTGYFGGVPTLAGQKWQFDREAAEAALTGLFRGQPTLQYRQWQAEQEARRAAQASEEARQRYLNALNLWQTYGIANDEISRILGIPVGARTADYDLSTLRARAQEEQAKAQEQINADFASDYATLKALPVRDAIEAMNTRWADMVAKYGLEGARQLWNEVLREAIEAGQATPR